MRGFAKLLGFGSEEEQAAKAISDAVDEQLSAGVQTIKIEEIVPNPYQPRKLFNDEALKELAASIQEHGVIQPLLVRRIDDRVELIAGERRLRASKLAGLTEVPVVVKEIDDKEMAELAMLENLQREDLHFLEEAHGFQHLINQFGFTQEELAVRLGKNQSTIANKLRLLKLTGDLQTMIVDDQLTERHARALLKIEDSTKQKEILEKVREKKLNVRETEELIEDTIDEISREISPKNKRQSVSKFIRDIRIYTNTIHNVVAEMKKAGIKVKLMEDQEEDTITISLKITKKK